MVTEVTTPARGHFSDHVEAQVESGNNPKDPLYLFWFSFEVTAFV